MGKTYEGPGAPVPGFDALRKATEQVGPPTTETPTTAASTLRVPLLSALELVILVQIAIPFAGDAAAPPVTDHLGVATLTTPVALLQTRPHIRATTQPEMPHISARPPHLLCLIRASARKYCGRCRCER